MVGMPKFAEPNLQLPTERLKIPESLDSQTVCKNMFKPIVHSIIHLLTISINQLFLKSLAKEIGPTRMESELFAVFRFD